MATLLDQLDTVRDGYGDECTWHKFLIDAYTGGGGFQGSVKQPPSGFWGAAAEAYGSGLFADASVAKVASSYLDRYPREDAEKYAARKAVSHYPNYVEPLTDLKLSYIAKRPPTVSGRPDEVEAWRKDMDGQGATFASALRVCRLRAAVLGWAPLLIDMPERPEGVLTRAQANAIGMRPRAVPLLPVNLVDYDVDDSGAFKWARIRTDYVDRPHPFAEPVKVAVHTTWWPDRFDRYEVRDDGGNRSAVQTHADVPHAFGRVPIAILRHKEDPGDPIKGLPMHAAVSKEAKALFNRVSELEEHIRSQVFLILVLAMSGDPSARGEVSIGTDNGLIVDPDQRNVHYYLAPPVSAAEILEKRIDTSIREIYRIARIEYGRATSGQVASGTARKFEFAQTNEALADYAGELARWELHVDRLVATAFGVSTDEESIEPQTDFGVEDLQADIKNVMDTVSLGVGATASKLLKFRVVEQQLPNMTADTRAAIEAEIDEIEAADAQETAFSREVDDASVLPPEPNDEAA